MSVHRSVALTIGLLTAGCSAPSPASRASNSADEQVVATAMKDYTAAIKTSDAARIAAWWTEDAIYIDRKAPTIRGRAALDSMLKVVFATMRVSDASVETDEIAVSGDVAYIIGRFDETLQPQNGDVQHDRGRFLFLWKRQPDGSWKIARSVGADLPGS
jgi:uncharacterized protein (TIGR02246 family)